MDGIIKFYKVRANGARIFYDPNVKTYDVLHKKI